MEVAERLVLAALGVIGSKDTVSDIAEAEAVERKEVEVVRAVAVSDVAGVGRGEKQVGAVETAVVDTREVLEQAVVERAESLIEVIEVAEEGFVDGRTWK